MDKFTGYERDARSGAYRNQKLLANLQTKFSIGELFTKEQIMACNNTLPPDEKVRGIVAAISELHENNQLKPVTKEGK
jgi:hypothetical protein